MPRRFLNRWIPAPERVRAEYGLSFFGRLLEHRDIWRFNRRTIARATAIGIFCSMMPIPFQMAIATAFSIVVGGNVPVAIALCWITNPLTIGPIFFGAYLLGTWILGMPVQAVEFEISVDWLLTTFSGVWPALVTGCTVIGATGAIFGFFGIRLAWRVAVVREWRRRRAEPRR